MASVQRSENLLEGLFSLFPTRTPLYNVCLSRKCLSFIQQGVKESNDTFKHVLISDIVGCKCRKSKTHNDNAAYFSVFAYPFRTKTFSGKRTRYRIELTFAIRTKENFEDNLKLAQRWRNVILCLSRGVKVEKSGLFTLEMFTEVYSTLNCYACFTCRFNCCICQIIEITKISPI